MTLLLATMTERFGLITQDTCSSRDDGARPDGWRGIDPLDASGPIVGHGTGMAPRATAYGLADKIGFFPRMRMITGCTGSLSASAHWALALGLGASFTDIDALVEAGGPAIFDRIARETAGLHEWAVAHLGWSHRHGRILGHLFSHDGARMHITAISDHVISPAPDVATPEYRRAYALHGTAGDSRGASAFHDAMADAVLASQASGFFRDGALIGGQLVSARIDEGGIVADVRRDLPDLEQRRIEAATGTRALLLGIQGGSGGHDGR